MPESELEELILEHSKSLESAITRMCRAVQDLHEGDVACRT